MIDLSMRLSIRSGRVEFLTALSLHALTAAACSSDSGSGPSLSEDVTPSTPAASVPTSPPVLAAAATAIVTSSDTLDSSATPGQAAGDAPATATSELDSIPDPVVAPTSVAQPTIAPTPDPSNTATPTPAPAPPPGPAATSTAVSEPTPTPASAGPPPGPVPTPAPIDPTATPSPASTATPEPAPTPTATPTPLPPAVLASNIVGFALSDITVAVGTTITWANQDSAPHTVTSGVPGSLTSEFDSGSFGIGESYHRSFNTPGTFAYFCTIHPFMQATITVQ